MIFVNYGDMQMSENADSESANIYNK